jgi:hypothetical protein
MNTDVCPRLVVGLKLVPQFRRLFLKVPVEVFVSGREISLFCPSPFFVASDADDNGLVIFFFDDRLESIPIEEAATFDARNPPIRECFAAV